MPEDAKGMGRYRLWVWLWVWLFERHLRDKRVWRPEPPKAGVFSVDWASWLRV
jgi:hypothetical protein